MDVPVAPDEQPIEPNTHAFVVKVWREEEHVNTHDTSWRGYVIHVASGQRHYITTLDQLDHFIVRYLRELHVKLPLVWRICHWWHR